MERGEIGIIYFVTLIAKVYMCIYIHTDIHAHICMCFLHIRMYNNLQ